MTLTLDVTQRLNLAVMLENFQWQGRLESWRACKLQDSIDLTDQEKKDIGYGRGQSPEGGEYFYWNRETAAGIVPAREFHFTDDDLARILRMLDAAPLSLKWYRSLQAQLPEPAEKNGATSPDPAGGLAPNGKP